MSSAVKKAANIGTLGILGNDNLFGTSQGTVPYTNVTTSSPWSVAAPYLTSGLGQAQSIYNQNQSGGLAGHAQDLTSKTLSGDFLSPESNPYFKAGLNDALGQAASTFAGQYGGPAGQNLNNSGYQESLARGLGAVATNAYGNLYGQERQNQMAAIPFAASLPYANLQNYMSAISPALQFGSSTTNAQQPFFQNNTATTLGALAGGVGAFKAFSDIRLKSNIKKIGQDSRGFGVYEYDIFGRRERGVIAQEVEKIIPEAVSEHLGMKMVDYGRIY